MDISDYDSVSHFAQAAASLGSIGAGILTASLSPSAGSGQKIFEVDFSALLTLLTLSWAWPNPERARCASQVWQAIWGKVCHLNWSIILRRRLAINCWIMRVLRSLRPIPMAPDARMLCQNAAMYYMSRLQLNHGAA